jgi:hypothetical protein
MGKQYRIHIRGQQRKSIDADLMAQLVVMMGRQLAEEAREAAEAAHAGETEETPAKEPPTERLEDRSGSSSGDGA